VVGAAPCWWQHPAPASRAWNAWEERGRGCLGCVCCGVAVMVVLLNGVCAGPGFAWRRIAVAPAPPSGPTANHTPAAHLPSAASVCCAVLCCAVLWCCSPVAAAACGPHFQGPAALGHLCCAVCCGKASALGSLPQTDSVPLRSPLPTLVVCCAVLCVLWCRCCCGGPIG
jgi:hypothetical protein